MVTFGFPLRKLGGHTHRNTHNTDALQEAKAHTHKNAVRPGCKGFSE